jgi:hypothetical protein
MTDEIDLGEKPKESSLKEIPSSPNQGKPKTHYPSFTLRGPCVDRFVKMFGNPDMGEKFRMSMALTCTGFNKDQYGQSISFDATKLSECDCDDVGKEDEEEGEEDKEDESEMVKTARKMKKG